MKKKIFAMVLTLCMVLTMMPSMAWAEESGEGPVYEDVLAVMYQNGPEALGMQQPYVTRVGESTGIMLMQGVKQKTDAIRDEVPIVYNSVETSHVQKNFTSFSIAVYRDGLSDAICELNGDGTKKSQTYGIEIEVTNGMKHGDDDPVYNFVLTVDDTQNTEQNNSENNPQIGLYTIQVTAAGEDENDGFKASMQFYVGAGNDWEFVKEGNGWYLAVDWENDVWVNLGFSSEWMGNTEQCEEMKKFVASYRNRIDNIIIEGNAQNLPCEWLNMLLGNLTWMDTRDSAEDENEISKNYVFDNEKAALFARTDSEKTNPLITIKKFMNGGDGGDEPEEPEHSTYFLGSLPDNNTSLKDRDISYKDRYINMSLEPNAKENCFYFAVPKGKTYQLQAYRLINVKAKDTTDTGDTRDREKNLLRCEGKNLLSDAFEMGESIERTIDGNSYDVYKINLIKYIGHGDIRVLVDEDNQIEENDTEIDAKADNWVDLRFALNVTVRGDTEGVKRLYNAADAQRNLFNFESEFPDVDLVQNGNARTGVYYNAMDVYYQGTRYKQGDYSEFALELEDGYVLNNISFKVGGKETPASFNVAREYDYAVYDEAGNMLGDEESNNFKDAGWQNGGSNYGGIVKDGPDKGKFREQGFIATKQIVLGNDAGFNNQYLVEAFFNAQPYKGKQYSLKYLGALTNHAVSYDSYYDHDGTIEIVFDVQKLPTASEVSTKVKDFDGKICIIPESNQGGHKYVVSSEVLQDYVLTGKDGLNEKLQKEYHDNYSVEKVFEITATADGESVSKLDKYITITIPKSMFKGNPKHYKVMNIDDNGNMVEMETTYELNGDYIVFKTGHLSKYAIVTNENVNTGSGSGGTSSGGAIAPVPSDVATSGTAGDKVTTAKTEVKTSEKVHADGTKETVAEVKISAANQREIIRQAKQNDSKEIILEVPARAAGNATSANVQLEKAFLNQLLDETSASLTIKTPFGDAAYTQDELKALSEKTDGDIVTLAVAKEDSAAEETERIAQAKAAAKQVDLKARSSRTSKGIKIVFKADEESKAFIESMKELGYIVKYRFYRSTKKASGYKAMLTKDEPVYVNTNGKTGAKYYYKVQLRAYDQNGRLIAATALRQCKYACRTWTK